MLIVMVYVVAVGNRPFDRSGEVVGKIDVQRGAVGDAACDLDVQVDFAGRRLRVEDAIADFDGFKDLEPAAIAAYSENSHSERQSICGIAGFEDGDFLSGTGTSREIVEACHFVRKIKTAVAGVVAHPTLSF